MFQQFYTYLYNLKEAQYKELRFEEQHSNKNKYDMLQVCTQQANIQQVYRHMLSQQAYSYKKQKVYKK